MSKSARGKVSTSTVGNPKLVNLLTRKAKVRDEHFLNYGKLKALSNDSKVNKKRKRQRIGNRAKQTTMTKE